MSFNIASLFASGIDTVVDSVGNALDKLVTSDEERGLIKNELEKIKINAILESENSYLKHEAEITKRWTNDNENLLTRAVRPAMVVWSFILFTIVILFDGNIGEFGVKEAYIPIVETILVTVVVAYFGGRSAEKWRKVSQNKL